MEDLGVGQRLDSFELKRPLGQGGFGEVWLAHDVGPHGVSKPVALKVLRVDDPKQTAALAQEAKLGCQLKHPNIVDLYRFGEVDGRPFLAMEFVEGSDLKGVMAELRTSGLRMPLSAAVDIGVGVARALEYAHTARGLDGQPLGLIHRDVKPANVMLSIAGEVKLADFGISKSSTSDATTTATGVYKGTPSYTAPEVWKEGKARRPNADLFALGAMLWEMVTGKRLFVGESAAAVAAQVLYGDPEGEQDSVRWFCPELAPVIAGLLERDPSARIATAGEARQRLEGVRTSLDAAGTVETVLELVGSLRLPVEERQPVGPQPDSVADDSWRRLILAARGKEDDAGPTAELPLDLLPTSKPLRGADAPAANASPLSAPADSSSAAGESSRLSFLPWALAAVAVLVALVAVLRPGEPNVAAVEPPAVEPSPLQAVEPPPDPSLAPVEQRPSPKATPSTRAPTPSKAATSSSEEPVGEALVTESTAAESAVAESPAAESAVDVPAVPEPTPEPTPAVATTGCVEFRSRTPGERVRVDGRTADFVARQKRPEVRSYPPGSIAVEVGSGSARAELQLEVRAGERVVVDCDLLVAGVCTSRVEPGGCP